MVEPACETSELLGVEASIGQDQLTIGHAAKDFVAGALSGMIGICAGQPLDTLRVRLQQRGDAGARRSSLAAIRSAEGIRGLYRGMSYPVCTTALQNAVTFQAQGAAARVLTGSSSRSSVTWQHTCIAGMFAGAVQSCISSPVELLKIRLQLQRALPGSPAYVGPLGVLRQVLATEGVPGLTRGLGLTLLRDTPSYGLYFLIYHWLLHGFDALLSAAPIAAQAHAHAAGADAGAPRLSAAAGAWQPQQAPSLAQQPQPQQQQPQPPSTQPVREGEQQAAQQPAALASFLAGGCAGALAWASIYPIDVVKSRMQASPRAASPYRGAWHCASASWRAEGGALFVRGLGATMGRGFVVNAAIFAAFEALMAAMA